MFPNDFVLAETIDQTLDHDDDNNNTNNNDDDDDDDDVKYQK